jgi:carbon storage regulator
VVEYRRVFRHVGFSFFSVAERHLLREGKPMLVLSRKTGEQLVIGENIRLTILAIKGNKVRIGITAPPEVRVDREEVACRIREFAKPQVVEAR